MESTLTVREIQAADIPLITAYWLQPDPGFMKGIGVDLSKIPGEASLHQMLSQQLSLPYDEKPAYCIIWLINGVPAGHCNVNKIVFGEEASMHLHLWNRDARLRGNGAALVRMSLPYFFHNLQLKKIYSEPYAFNPAPNKTLEKAGFSFVKEYTTTPGSLNFEQPVFRWELTAEDWTGLS